MRRPDRRITNGMTQMVLRIRQLMCPSRAHSDLQSHFSIVQPCRSISSLPGSTQLGGCATSHQSIFGSFESKLGPYLCFFSCRNPDAYHTAYCISGMSAAQHHVYPSPTRREEVRAAWEGEGGVRTTVFAEALCWTEEDGGSHIVGSAANRVVRHLLPLWSSPFC